MISAFYMNMQIRWLVDYGYIDFSNDDLLPEYEAELQRRKIKYKVVSGLGKYGVTTAICSTPERYKQFAEQLKREIKDTREVLAIKESALKAANSRK